MNTFIKTAGTAIARLINARISAFLSGTLFLTGWATSASASDASVARGGIVDFVVGLFESTQALFTQFYFADHAALWLAGAVWVVGAIVAFKILRGIVLYCGTSYFFTRTSGQIMYDGSTVIFSRRGVVRTYPNGKVVRS